MKKIFFFLSIITLCHSALAQSSTIWYVTQEGTNQNNGTSWSAASNDLQAIINNASSGDEIWVAKGTYIPIRPINDYANNSGVDSTNRNNAFVVDKDINLYGGFIGSEATIDERSWFESRTILSGDLASDDDGNSANTSDNAYHVLIIASTGTVTIDGFTISGGNANGTGNSSLGAIPIDQSFGGGLYNEKSNAILTNLIITKSYAVTGGGIYNNTSSSTILTNIIVVNNAATNGGGIYNKHTDAVLTNLTLANNTASSGSELTNNASSPTIRNSVIWNDGDNVVNNEVGSTPQYYYSLAKNITANSNGNIEGSVNPLFHNASYYIPALISPLINSGNNAYYQSGSPDLTSITTDITGRSRIYGSSVDIGAFEYQGNAEIIIPNADGILYVNRNIAGGSNDGSSWGNAVPRLCDALKASEALNNAYPDTIKQVWVAKGTYYSIHKSAEIDSEGKFTTARDNAFSLVKDVKLYGGFNGTETDIDQRDLINNETILSGDFLKNDDMSDPNTMKDNAYHVVFSAGEMGSALIDGFTITGGYADVNKFVMVNGVKMYSAGGAGLYIQDSSPEVSNLIIKNNATTYRGGGMLLVNSASEITNLTINHNEALYGGGGVHIQHSGPKMTNIIITNNKAAGGGGMVNRESSSVITNMLIAGNTANDGGGLYNLNSSPTYTNVTITNNTAFLGSGMYNGGASNPVGRNSVIWGNNGSRSVYSETGSENSSSYCLIEGETENDNNKNIPGTINPMFVGNGDYRLSLASPLANKGNNEYYLASNNPNLSNITTDLAGNPRIQHGVVDIGAYESDNNSGQADLQKVYINGTLHDINEIYTIACDYTRNVVDVEIEIPLNATININKIFSLNVSEPSLYKVNFTITSHDGSIANDYTLMVEKYFAFEELVVQKWNNTLIVNNNPSTNGGHTFTACTWYKNGAAVSNKLFYSAGSSSSDLLNANDEYYLALIKDNGDIMHTCPGKVALKHTQAVVYPNPVRSGTQLYLKVDANENNNLTGDGRVEIYSFNGVRLNSTNIQGSLTPLSIQGPPGVYIVRLQAKNVVESIKVIVQ